MEPLNPQPVAQPDTHPVSTSAGPVSWLASAMVNDSTVSWSMFSTGLIMMAPGSVDVREKAGAAAIVSRSRACRLYGAAKAQQ
jgi:hypothetical protein